MSNQYSINSEKIPEYSSTVSNSVFEQFPFSIQVTTPDGWTLHVNKAWERLFGVTYENIGRYNVLQDEQLRQSGFIPYIEKGFAGETVRVPAFSYAAGPDVTDSKNIRWLQTIISPVMERGVVTAVMLIHEDITEQQEVKNIQQERKRQLQTITDSLPALIGVLDTDLRYSYCNKTYEKWFGTTIDKILGKHIKEVIGQVAFDKIEDKLHRVINGSVENFDGYLVYPSGNERYVSSTMIPKFNCDQLLEEIYILVNDRTPYKRAEEKAIHHHNELAHLARVSMISELATGLAHEINQPLATIKLLSRIGLLQLESEDTDHEKLRESLDNIGAQAMRAGDIIRHLRRLVANKVPQKVAVNLNLLIGETISFIGTEIREAGVTVEQDLEDDLPEVCADKIQIQQVLINILLNSIDAIKKANNPKGKIVVTSCYNNQTYATVTIADTGCGMDKDTVNRMFNSFFTTKGEMGIGIGLSICRSLIESHEGEIHANSTPGKGTTLAFTLPFV